MIKEYLTEILAVIGFIWAIIENIRNYKFKKAEKIRGKKLEEIIKLQTAINEIKFQLFKFMKEKVIKMESLLAEIDEKQPHNEFQNSRSQLDKSYAISIISNLFNDLYESLDESIEKINLVTLNGLVKTKLNANLLALTQEIYKFQRAIKIKSKYRLNDNDWNTIVTVFRIINDIEFDIKKELS